MNEELYKRAFYYAVGIISSFPYYEELHPEEIAENIIQRVIDLVGEDDEF
jgi:hypothetical protein